MRYYWQRGHKWTQTLALLFCLAASYAISADTGLPFELSDQYGRQVSIQFPRERLLLLVFSGRSNNDQVGPWIHHIEQQQLDHDTIFIAAVGDVPAFVRPAVQRLFRGRPPILLDWGNSVSSRYGYSTEILLIMISPDGAVIARAEGAITQDKLTEFFGELSGRRPDELQFDGGWPTLRGQ